MNTMRTVCAGLLICCGSSLWGSPLRAQSEAEEAFAVVHHECSAATYTLAHEIGHIIGARHDLTLDKNMTPFPMVTGTFTASSGATS